jgi:hypothetical protein
LRHAKSLLLILEQVRHDIGLFSRFRASITVGTHAAFWEALLPQWFGALRNYMVFPHDSDSILLQQALETLRSLAVVEQQKAMGRI